MCSLDGVRAGARLDDVLDDAAASDDVDRPVTRAHEALRRIDTQLRVNGRAEIVRADDGIRGLRALGVGGTMNDAALDAATGLDDLDARATALVARAVAQPKLLDTVAILTNQIEIPHVGVFFIYSIL